MATQNRKISVSGKEIEVSIETLRTMPHELTQSYLNPVAMTKHLNPTVYKKILAFIKAYTFDFNDAVKAKSMSVEASEFFDDSCVLAKELMQADEKLILLGSAYKLSDDQSRWQLMAGWYYLTGLRKGKINYALIGKGLMVSKFENEQAKGIKLIASPVSVKQAESVSVK